MENKKIAKKLQKQSKNAQNNQKMTQNNKKYGKTIDRGRAKLIFDCFWAIVWLFWTLLFLTFLCYFLVFPVFWLFYCVFGTWPLTRQALLGSFLKVTPWDAKSNLPQFPWGPSPGIPWAPSLRSHGPLPTLGSHGHLPWDAMDPVLISLHELRPPQKEEPRNENLSYTCMHVLCPPEGGTSSIRWGSPGPPNWLGGPRGPQIYKKYSFLITNTQYYKTNREKSKNSKKTTRIFSKMRKKSTFPVIVRAEI